MTLLCKSVGIWDGIVNPIYWCRVRMTPGINPIYARFKRPCPRDSKNVSYVDVGLVIHVLTWLKVVGGGRGGWTQ